MIKIGIMQTAFLGDTILIAPMLESIKNKHGENTEIFLILKKGLEPVFAYDPRVKSIVTFDKRGTEKGISGIFKIIKKIKELKLDVLINVHRSMRSGIVTRFSGVGKTIGFDEAKLSFMFTTSVSRMGDHEVLKNHRLLCAFDVSLTPKYPRIRDAYRLFIDPEADKNVSELLMQKGITGEFITIAPGSKWNTKRWTVNGFADLIRMLVDFRSYSIVLTGDKEDQKIIDEIMQQVKAPSIVSLCGNLDLQSLFALIKRSKLLVTNDSAPQHIAVGVGCPVVSLFGPTTKRLGYFPFSEKARVLEGKTDCRPCGTHGHNECPKRLHDCMYSIKADAVFRACKDLMGA